MSVINKTDNEKRKTKNIQLICMELAIITSYVGATLSLKRGCSATLSAAL